MFGPPVNIKVHENPQEYLQNNPEVVDQHVEVAQDAFNKDGVPTYEDTEQHVLDVETLITAERDGELLGFSSVDRKTDEDIVYEVGIAVEQGEQGNGLGSILLTRGVAEEADGDELFGYRTQNPCMYACADRNFDEIFPQPEKETPEDMQEVINLLGEDIDESKEMDGAVQREAYSDVYDGGMYSEIPEDRRFSSFFNNELGVDQSEGDAVIVAGEVNSNEAMEQYHNLVNKYERRAYRKVLEDGKEVKNNASERAKFHTFTEGPRK